VTAKSLLQAGTVAGPLFVVSSLVQATLRAGFDPAQHPPSALALGGAGWVQVLTFVLAARSTTHPSANPARGRTA
jgi:uncharacterized protein DUF998